MRALLVLAPVSLLLFAGPAPGAGHPDPQTVAEAPTPDMPVKPKHHAHHSRAARKAKAAAAVAAEDSDSRVGQIPAGALGPPGQRIPEVGPEPPKTRETDVPPKPNTANCSGANADPTTCYTATQQGRAK